HPETLFPDYTHEKKTDQSSERIPNLIKKKKKDYILVLSLSKPLDEKERED
ncbi:981_t:CDS:1, partial [Gigaspora rosea]